MATDALEALRTSVESFFGQCDPPLKYDRIGDDFRLLFGTIMDPVAVWVAVQEVDEGVPIAQVWALVAVDVDVTEDLEVYLCEENTKTLFGKLTCDAAAREVRFEHPLLGAFLNRAEIEMAVHAVAFTANEYDDVMRDRFGGKRPPGVL